MDDEKLRWKKFDEYKSDDGVSYTQFARPQNDEIDIKLYRMDKTLKNIKLKTVESFYNIPNY